MSKQDIDNTLANLVIVTESNILYPHECSKKDHDILEFQDRVIKYQEFFDQYSSYTEVIAHGYNRVKMVTGLIKGIIL